MDHFTASSNGHAADQIIPWRPHGNRMEIVRLVQHHLDMYRWNRGVLHEAVEHQCSQEMVELLLEKGCLGTQSICFSPTGDVIVMVVCFLSGERCSRSLCPQERYTAYTVYECKWLTKMILRGATSGVFDPSTTPQPFPQQPAGPGWRAKVLGPPKDLWDLPWPSQLDVADWRPASLSQLSSLSLYSVFIYMELKIQRNKF